MTRATAKGSSRARSQPAPPAQGSEPPPDDAARPCSGARTLPLSRQDADALSTLLKAVADPVRLRLLSMISASETGEMCVCDLVEPAGVSQPTVSHHLRVLTTAGLVTRERRASWAWYRIVPEPLDRIRALLP